VRVVGLLVEGATVVGGDVVAGALVDAVVGAVVAGVVAVLVRVALLFDDPQAAARTIRDSNAAPVEKKVLLFTDLPTLGHLGGFPVG
jgi:hypothetical protein